MSILKGNRLQARLNELGYETDNSDWDDESDPDRQNAELDIEGEQE